MKIAFVRIGSCSYGHLQWCRSVCRYTPNFYAFLNGGNVYYQRMKEWMFAELTRAEKAGDKVCAFVYVCVLKRAVAFHSAL